MSKRLGGIIGCRDKPLVVSHIQHTVLVANQKKLLYGVRRADETSDDTTAVGTMYCIPLIPVPRAYLTATSDHPIQYLVQYSRSPLTEL